MNIEHDDYDDLDRALLALPLEPAPADLRPSILAATIYASARMRVEPIARTWEVLLVGLSLAIATWLSIALAVSKNAGAVFMADLTAATRVLADPATLQWYAAGVVITAALWYAGDMAGRFPSRGARV